MSNCILIVDDESDLRECLVELLEEEGYSVAQAVNGLEALNYLKHAETLPCLVLLDFMMPIMDGEGFMIEFLKIPRLKNTPVVLITAATIQEQTIEAMQLSGHIPKPIKIEQFLQQVKKFCPHN